VKKLKEYPLRIIAERVLTQRFGDLGAALLADLATSLVRQWLTYNGHAGIITQVQQFWFSVCPNGESLDVGFGDGRGMLGHVLERQWLVPADDVPELMHRLNICQSAVCRTTRGTSVRVSIIPQERTVRFEDVAEDEE
jgi:hypothetical protein